MRLPDDKVAALKTAVHVLIERVGGLLAAASVCRVSVSVLSEYQSRNHPDRMMPVDVALQLEAVAGEPVVTSALARLQGLRLARPDAGAVPAVGAAVGAVAARAGTLASMLLAAYADGTLDDAECAALRGVAEQVRNAADATLFGLAPAPASKVVA